MKGIKILGFIILATCLFACKKGEDDPFISIYSRDNRITNNWSLKTSSYSETITVATHGESNTVSYLEKVINGSLTSSFPSTDGSVNSNSVTYTEELTIKKDGTYSWYKSRDGIETTVSGEWFWLDDQKNKVGIQFFGERFYIQQLKKKELILTQTEEILIHTDGGNMKTEVDYELVFVAKE